MKIYTKGGDKGETGLFGGKRIPKDSLRIEAYGTIDELNSFIGLAIYNVKNEEIKTLLKKIQNQLFDVGADLASPDDDKAEKHNIERTPSRFYLEMENSIDYFDSQLDELNNFILPGGSKSSALLHICRTITRRLERKVVALSKNEQVGENIIIYLNRLSDLFFVLSRIENKVSNIPDTIWNKP